MMQTELLNVTGMACGSCVSKVVRALSAVSGVSDVEVSLVTEEAKVQYDDQQTLPEQLKAAVRRAGYRVDDIGSTRNDQGGCCCS